jgi:hypothetical protein
LNGLPGREGVCREDGEYGKKKIKDLFPPYLLTAIICREDGKCGKKK